MRPRHAVLPTPSVSLRSVPLPHYLPKSFPCHTSENSPVSPAIATDPKTHLSKSCICHTSDIPPGVALASPTLGLPHPQAFQRFLQLSTIPFTFKLLRTLLHSPKPQPFCFQSLPHSLPKTTRGGGRVLTTHPPSERSRYCRRNPAFSCAFLGGLPAMPASSPANASPRLYSPLRRSPLARSRQKYPADPQRSLPHRESPRRQPRLSRLDARLSLSIAPCPGAASRFEQFYPVDCLVPRRHAHSSFLWNLHSRRAGRRWPYRHFQWLDHAQKQRGIGPRAGGAEKSESHRCFPQRLLPSHSPAHGWAGFHLHGYHSRRKRASPSRSEPPRDSRRGDWFGPRRGEHLSLLRLRRSSRRDHRRKRDEHHPAPLFLSPRLHRRPNSLERRASFASLLARTRGLRLPRRAWCMMEFHHRDETRSPAFHCVPQLCRRIVFKQRRDAARRRWPHHGRGASLPRLRFAIRDSQRRADSAARESRQRQPRDRLALCRGMDALERSSRLLRAGIF